jgi:deoxyadenosine/deoxycytidine kinase
MKTVAAESSVTISTTIIALEGNISSGKTTLCGSILNDKKRNVRVLFEPVVRRLLKLFCDNQLKYAFALQLFMFTTRYDAFERMMLCSPISLSSPGTGMTIVDKPLPVIGVLDRSIFGDIVFAMNQHLAGNFNADEWATYVDIVKSKNWLAMLKQMTIVYLHTEPKRCRMSVEQRKSVDENVQEDYLDDIDTMHIYGLLHIYTLFGKRARVLDWREFGTTADFWSVIENGSSHYDDEKDDSVDIVIDDESNLVVARPGSFAGVPKSQRRIHSPSWKQTFIDAMIQNKPIRVIHHADENMASYVPSLYHATRRLWNDLA